MQRGLETFAGHSSFILIRKKQYLVTLALVSPRRNRRSRAQTSIFTIENQHFLVQMAPEASWPPDVSAESLEARSPQPGVLSQASSARIPQLGVLSQESSARIPQPDNLSQESSARSPQPGVLSQESSAGSLQPICLGSALESFSFFQKMAPIFLEAPNLLVPCLRRFFLFREMPPTFLEAPNLWVRCRRRFFFSQKNGPQIFEVTWVSLVWVYDPPF